MKEYIFQPTIAQDAGVITIADAPTGLTKKNILAIINKTTKGIVHSPLVNGVATVNYAGTELAIILYAGHESIAGDLLIKAYTEEEEGGGGLEIATEEEYAVFKSHMETEIANILTPITEE